MSRLLQILVTGAGGFIGHHLVNRLVADGHWVRGVDIKQPEFAPSLAEEFLQLDLREWENARRAVQGVDRVFHLAADMGGIGYITVHKASVARNNSLINLNILEAARRESIEKLVFASSACVYRADVQAEADVAGLREEDAYPAMPEPGYGWEKLYAEELCRYYRDDYGLDTKPVRFHNVYGPLGTYKGGREKAPAAACRKIARAQDGATIEIWGDGRQTRSFLFVDDCIAGLVRIMDSDISEPINLGSEEMVTVDRLFDIVAAIAGKSISKKHNTSRAMGVRGRNSDNTKLRRLLGWAPSLTLAEGLVPTYNWIVRQLESDAIGGLALPGEASYRVSKIAS